MQVVVVVHGDVAVAVAGVLTRTICVSMCVVCADRRDNVMQRCNDCVCRACPPPARRLPHIARPMTLVSVVQARGNGDDELGLLQEIMICRGAWKR